MAKKTFKHDEVKENPTGGRSGVPRLHWQWAIVVAVGVPLLFAVFSAYPLFTGSTVILEVLPVDPFDMFRGQYMVLAYDVSVVKLSEAHVGEGVYVSIIPDAAGVWRATSVSKKAPGGVFLAGRIVDTNPRGLSRRTDASDQNSVRVEYGIEQWFFERNAEFSQQNLTAEVKIARDGRARIVRLLQNGKPMNITYKEPGLFS